MGSKTPAKTNKAQKLVWKRIFLECVCLDIDLMTNYKMATSIDSHFEHIKVQFFLKTKTDLNAVCIKRPVFQILLDSIHLYSCDIFLLTKHNFRRVNTP